MIGLYLVFVYHDLLRRYPEQMKYPAPDFIAEILSPSTESVDRITKFEDYAAHGVAEYWLIDPAKKIVEQYDSQANESP